MLVVSQNVTPFYNFDFFFAGNLAANYPPPYVIARFCVFDSCQSYGAFSAFRSRGSVQTCYFAGCGRSAVVAQDCAKLSINHCEFAQTDRSEQTISSSHSDITLSGCYFHGLLQPEFEKGSRQQAQAVALTCKSVANVTKNYFFKTGNGISAIDADLYCAQNLILNCCQHGNHQQVQGQQQQWKSTLGLYTALCIKVKGNKVQIVNNHLKNCDVGIYVGQGASPAIKDNNIEASFFTGIFVECESKPNLVNNHFNGGAKILHKDQNSSSSIANNTGKGLGILFISNSCGLVGKNHLHDFEVSPIMVFSTCHPLLKDNVFDNIQVDDEKQKSVEKQMLEQFQAELFAKDEYFYIVDSEVTEKELHQVILSKKTSSTI